MSIKFLMKRIFLSWKTTLAYFLFWLLAFSAHQFMVYHSEFIDIEVLEIYERVADGLERPAIGKDVGNTGFHTGPFEFYLMALPFALGLGFSGVAAWLSLLWTLGVAVTMLTVRRHLSRDNAWLAGLAMANAIPYIIFTLNFQNNCLIPAFVALWCAVALEVAFSKRVGFTLMAVAGLMVGILPQVHFACLFLIPAAAVLWWWCKPRIGVLAWFVSIAFALAPWGPYIYYEALSNWPNLTALWQSGLSDNIPTVGPSRFWSWLILFLSPAGALTLVFLIFGCWTACRGRLNMPTVEKKILVFFLLQLIIPLLAYDFFKRNFLTIFLPAFPIICAMSPGLALAAWNREKTKNLDKGRMRRLLNTLMAGLIIIVPAPLLFFHGTKLLNSDVAIRKTGTMIELARHACILGLPIDKSWHNRIVGLKMGVSRQSWDFMRRHYTQDCDDTKTNNVLLILQERYVPDPQDNAKIDFPPMAMVGTGPLLTKNMPATEDNINIEGSLFPKARFLYLDYAVHEFQPYQDEPRLVIGGKSISILHKLESVLSNGSINFEYVFQLPPHDSHLNYSLIIPKGPMRQSVTVFARQNRLK